jgi:hypothetical protein
MLTRPERTGLALNTVKAYGQDTPRRIPKPDAMIGRVKGSTVETIDAWHARRAKWTHRLLIGYERQSSNISENQLERSERNFRCRPMPIEHQREPTR